MDNSIFISNTIRVSSSLDPDQDQHYVGPNLDSKRFAKRVHTERDTYPSNLGPSDPAVTILGVAANFKLVLSQFTFCEYFIFANSIKRYICHIKNSQLLHDLE